MSDIFVSYSNHDKEVVKNLVRVLERQGWSVWWDSNIPPGRKFDDVILGEIISSKCMVVVWTAHSVESDWVKEEALEAGKRKKSVIPILLEEVEIPFGFRRLEASKLIGWRGAADDDELKLLLKTIANVLSHEPKALKKASKKEGPPTSAPPKTSERTPRPTASTRREFRPFVADGGDIGKRHPSPVVRSNLGFSRNPDAWKEFLARQAAWRESPEYKEEQARQKAAWAKAERQRLVFYKSDAWWFSLVVLPGACVAAALFSNWLVQLALGRFDRFGPPIGVQLVVTAAGLLWGLTYVIAAAKNSFRWWHVFIHPFLPYGDIFEFLDFEDFCRGLLSALPVNLLSSLVIARGLSIGAMYLFELIFSNITIRSSAASEVILYSTFGALTIGGVSWYLLNLDDYDLIYFVYKPPSDKQSAPSETR